MGCSRAIVPAPHSFPARMIMKLLPTHGAFFVLLTLTAQAAEPLKLSRAEYADRTQAAWTAQIAGVYLGFLHEHR